MNRNEWRQERFLPERQPLLRVRPTDAEITTRLRSIGAHEGDGWGETDQNYLRTKWWLNRDYALKPEDHRSCMNYTIRYLRI